MKFNQSPTIFVDDSGNFLGWGNVVAGSQLIAKNVHLEMTLKCSQGAELYKPAAQISTSYLSSSGKPALIQAFQPPSRANTLLYPLSLKDRATRALVRSCFQEQ